MRLGDFYGGFFEANAELEIRDVPFLYTMMFRMIEDTEIVAYTVARSREQETITEETVSDALQLIEPDEEEPAETENAVLFSDATVDAVVTYNMVQEVVRAPLPHADAAIALLARYVNYHLINMLHAAAEIAQSEESPVIETRHLLPQCEKWPYPLNRFC